MIPLSLALLFTILPTQSELVIVKEGNTEYHRPGCEVIRDGKGVLAMTRAQAESRGHKPHAACDPANQPVAVSASSEMGASAKKKGTVPPSTFVFVDSGKYYHREGCKRLGKDAKKLALDEAGRKYWPCSVCRPPIRPRKR